MISRGGYHKFSVSSVFSHRFRSLSRRCIRNFASQIEGNQNHHNEEDPQFLAEVKSTNQNFMKPISHINRAVRNSVMGTNFMNYKNLCIGFDNLETQVRSEIEREARENRPQLLTLPRVSSILNGLRLGELTIFTGPTGCGKTTVLSQISLDYCMQGVKVIWGSFEVRNTRLSQIMLQQIAMQPIISDRIGKKLNLSSPIFFYTHHSTIIQNVPNRLSTFSQTI